MPQPESLRPNEMCCFLCRHYDFADITQLKCFLHDFQFKIEGMAQNFYCDDYIIDFSEKEKALLTREQRFYRHAKRCNICRYCNINEKGKHLISYKCSLDDTFTGLEHYCDAFNPRKNFNLQHGWTNTVEYKLIMEYRQKMKEKYKNGKL